MWLVSVEYLFKGSSAHAGTSPWAGLSALDAVELMNADDTPAVWLNQGTMDRFRPALRQHYYDPTRHKSYLEQLEVPYPPPMPEPSSARQ